MLNVVMGNKKNKKFTWKGIKVFCVFVLKTLRVSLDPQHRVRWKYKALWAFLNVMLPELALAISLDEWRKSRDLLKALHKLKLKDNSKSKYLPFANWDMTMGFYAVMGGFYVPNPPPRTLSSADIRGPTLERSEGNQENIGNLVDDTMQDSSSATKGQNEYCNWSLVKRCCDISRNRIDHHNLLRKKRGKLSWIEKKELDEKKPRHVLTTHGVLYMARLLIKMQECAEQRLVPGYTGASCEFRDSNGICNCPQHATILEHQFRDITSEIIDDLSKSDWMGRVFFLVQSGWMIIQTAARYYSHPRLPITLLELHASLHVAVAALQYMVWWRKPIDMVVMTPLSLPYGNFVMGKTEDLTNHLFLDDHYHILVGSCSDTNSQTHETPTGAPLSQHRHTQSQFQDHNSAASITQQTPSQPVQGIPAGERDELLTDSDGREPDVFTVRMQRWWSGLLEIEDSGQISEDYLTSQATLGKEGSKQIAGISIPHHPFHGIVLAVVRLTLTWQRWPFKILLWFSTCLIYSSAHLAAWHWHFPTHFEKVVWHWCTIFTTASLALLALLGLLASLYRFLRIWGYQRRKEPPKKHLVADILTDIVCSDFLLGLYRNGVRLTGLSIAIGVTPWLLARLYIFVEAVISIRSVEKGTYDTVKWTGFIPHI